MNIYLHVIPLFTGSTDGWSINLLKILSTYRYELSSINFLKLSAVFRTQQKKKYLYDI